MLAASYWSLLAPSIEMAEISGLYGNFVFLPVSLGFAGGAAFVYFADLLLPMLVRVRRELCASSSHIAFQENLIVCICPAASSLVICYSE